MNISMNFEGYVAEIVSRALERGIVKTKTEAVRLGLLKLDESFHLVGEDWHPADAKEFKEDFVSSVEKAVGEKSVKAKTVSELFE